MTDNIKIDRKIVMEAQLHGIKREVLKELLKEYEKYKKNAPKNFAELIEGALC